MSDLTNFVGQRFTRLTVVAFSHVDRNQKKLWLCRCDCGMEKVVVTSKLTGGFTKSCGCLRKELTSKRNLTEAAAFEEERVKEMTGRVYHRLTVNRVSHVKVTSQRIRYWSCRCDCGNTTIVKEADILSGTTKSCGCLNHESKHVPDLIGRRVGLLTVIRIFDKDNSGNVRWECECDCGNTSYPRTTALVKNTTLSCGCFGRELSKQAHTTHGMSNSPEFVSWMAMRKRCNDPNASNYSDYGGRGITVCPTWNASFETFYRDMGPRPEGTTLDRKESSKGYDRDNCRWADPTVQSVNQRTSRKNTSGVVGVSQTQQGTWRAQLQMYGKSLLNETFNSFEEAVSARAVAESKHLARIKDSSV